MCERLVNVGRETPMLLPADLREWVPADDLVPFVISAVETVSVDGTHIKANASKHKRVRYDQAGDLEQKLPREIERREVLLEKMRWGRGRRSGHQSRRRRTPRRSISPILTAR
jgi:hypothetical protein